MRFIIFYDYMVGDTVELELGEIKAAYEAGEHVILKDVYGVQYEVDSKAWEPYAWRLEGVTYDN